MEGRLGRARRWIRDKVSSSKKPQLDMNPNYSQRREVRWLVQHGVSIEEQIQFKTGVQELIDKARRGDVSVEKSNEDNK